MKRLSDRKDNNSFAYCESCKEYFIDDLAIYGSILCPNNCRWVVRRGYVATFHEPGSVIEIDNPNI